MKLAPVVRARHRRRLQQLLPGPFPVLEDDHESDICSSTCESLPGQYLATYSARSQPHQARPIAVNSAGQIGFDFAYPTTVCTTAFLARPFGFDKSTLR